MSKIKGIYAASMSILNDNLTLDIKKTIQHTVGGAHRDPRAASASLGSAIGEELDQLAGYAPHELKRLREERFLALAG